MNKEYLGPFEKAVIAAVLALGSNAYGMTIRRYIAERMGRDVSIGAVYTTLTRLEQKGYVSSFVGEPTRERGGRAKKFFQLEAAGQYAFQRTVARDQQFSDIPGAVAPGIAGELA